MGKIMKVNNNLSHNSEMIEFFSNFQHNYLRKMCSLKDKQFNDYEF